MIQNCSFCSRIVGIVFLVLVLCVPCIICKQRYYNIMIFSKLFRMDNDVLLFCADHHPSEAGQLWLHRQHTAVSEVLRVVQTL